MEVVVLVIHLFIALGMIGVILLQRSEGGALGIGGGGGAGGLFSARGAANGLTRTTAYLAAAFFVTSIVLTLLARGAGGPASILDTPGGANPAAPTAPAPLDPLSSLQPQPATPAPAPAPEGASAPASPTTEPAPAPANAPAAAEPTPVPPPAEEPAAEGTKPVTESSGDPIPVPVEKPIKP